ncbi:hypothetical protein BDA99DRAFT_563912 [Phascolomyces articulosus]|uniref:F-box domain-containing protein n=1 Tax=Phascolomyces articulosus TaxID=60185 RepID=A0AAD5PBC5_9FUNG|nr:hypothetical protein BDA99DRAFT_563912 [Phascolomyces articulosus]
MPNNEHTFINQLPFDIVTSIFSFLNQQECLTCMSVCRPWFDEIPQYTINNWKTVQLFPSRQDNSNSRSDIANDDLNPYYRLKYCLGNHLENVEFCGFSEEDDQKKLLMMMQMLIDCGCNQIQSLVFKRCATIHQESFFQKLCLFGESQELKHVSMLEHQSNISLLYILYTCPQLTHLTFYPTHSAWRKFGIYTIEPPVMLNDDDYTTTSPQRQHLRRPASFEHLIYLHIDAEVDRRLRLEYILKKCPNLRYLMCASAQSCELAPDSIQLDELVQWCPKLVYFAGDGSYRYHDDAMDLLKTAPLKDSIHHDDPEEKPFIDNNKNDNNNTDNEEYIDNDSVSTPTSSSTSYFQKKKRAASYHLSICEHQGYDQIAQHLQKQQQRLGHLRLVKPIFHHDGRDWSPIFQSLHLYQLRTLICDRIDFSDMSSLITLLNTCARTIQIVDVDIRVLGLHTMHLTVDQSIIEGLHVLQHLHTLRLCGFSFPNKASVVTLLERVPGLEKWVLQESLVTFNVEPIVFESLKNLNTLELVDVHWDDSELNNDNDRQLQSPQQQNEGGDGDVGDNSMIVVSSAFFQCLPLLQKDNYSKLTTIRFIRIPKMTNELLFSIAHIPTLKVLHLTPDYISPLFLPPPPSPPSPTTTTSSSDNSNSKSEDKNDMLLDFIQILRGSAAIEQLILHHIGCPISNAAFTTLGDLTQLKILDILLVGTNTNIPPSPIDMEGILQLVYKTKTLEKMTIHNAASLEGPPGGILQRVFQQRHISWYTVTSMNRHSTRTTHTNDNTHYLYIDDCTITRS